jgi:hypothetical protein|tara:strand:- start:12810 stop:13253 length:444 start_codon:yes stop_codon:yes gene_type:complete
MAEEELDEAVNDIIAQIKGNNKVVREKKEDVTIDKENLEEFIMKSSGKLVKKSLEIVDNVNDYISSAPENRDVAALAEVIKATSASIDTLQKLHSSNERNDTQKEVKKMDVESKERLNIADNQTRMLLSRDDIMKALVDKDDDVIDV